MFGLTGIVKTSPPTHAVAEKLSALRCIACRVTCSATLKTTNNNATECIQAACLSLSSRHTKTACSTNSAVRGRCSGCPLAIRCNMHRMRAHIACCIAASRRTLCNFYPTCTASKLSCKDDKLTSGLCTQDKGMWMTCNLLTCERYPLPRLA